MPEQQYENVCKPRLENVEKRLDMAIDKIGEIHAIITNGLKDGVKENRERVKAIDARLWGLLISVFFSIGLQILFKVIL